MQNTNPPGPISMHGLAKDANAVQVELEAMRLAFRVLINAVAVAALPNEPDKLLHTIRGTLDELAKQHLGTERDTEHGRSVSAKAREILSFGAAR